MTQQKFRLKGLHYEDTELRYYAEGINDLLTDQVNHVLKRMEEQIKKQEIYPPGAENTGVVAGIRWSKQIIKEVFSNG